jgi:hypothetical protein
MRQLRSVPRSPQIDTIKEKFAALNDFVTARHGWLTSIPGDPEVTMECLPGSSLPDDLRGLGHQVREAGDGERILPAAIVERFTRRTDGELEPLTVGSTKPVAETRTHAGIIKVKRYSFDMPS